MQSISDNSENRPFDPLPSGQGVGAQCDFARLFLKEADSRSQGDLKRHLADCPTCKAFFGEHRAEFGDLADTDPLKTVQSTPNDTHWMESPREFTLRSSEERPWPIVDIPGFTLQRLLGKTRHSQVFLARQESLDRLVAIKFVKSGELLGWKEMPRESAVLATLQHPNILTIFETGQWCEGTWLCLEYCAQGSLAEKLTEPWDPKEAARLLETVARAVQSANAAGIIHRDIKPANILFGAAGQPKLADFGIAHRWDTPKLPDPGKIVGTPSYMAPEQVASQFCDARTDVHALGAVLYHLLTGRPPFRGKDVLETLHLVENHEPVRVEVRNPSVPLDLAAICWKCLAKDPNARYAHAGELADDLNRFLANAPVSARPLGLIARTGRALQANPSLALGAGLFASSMALVLFLSLPVIKNGDSSRDHPSQNSGKSAPDPTLPLRYAADMRSLSDLAEKGQWAEVRTILDLYAKDGSTQAVRGWEWDYWVKRLPDRDCLFSSSIYRDWALTEENDLIGLDPDGRATLHPRDQYEKPTNLPLNWGGRVVAVAISPRGTLAAAVIEGKKLALFKGLPDQPQLRNVALKTPFYPRVLAVFEDGKTVLGIDWTTGQLCKVDTNDGSVQTLPLGVMEDKSMITLHRSSPLAASVTKDGKICFWNATTGEIHHFQLQDRTLTGLNWSNDFPLLGAMVREKTEGGGEGNLLGWLVVEPGKDHWVLDAKPGKQRGMVLPINPEKTLIVTEGGQCEIRDRTGRILGTSQVVCPTPLKAGLAPKHNLALIQEGLGFTRVSLDALETPPREWDFPGVGLDIHWLDNKTCALSLMENKKSPKPFSPSRLINTGTRKNPREAPTLTEGRLWSTRLTNRSWIAAMTNAVELHDCQGSLVASAPLKVKRLASKADRIACLTSQDTIVVFDDRLGRIEEFPAEGAHSVGLDGSGGIWITTRDRSLARRTNQGWQQAFLPEGSRPTQFLCGKDDRIWVGTTLGHVLEFGSDGELRRQFQAGNLGILSMDLDPQGKRLIVSTMERIVRIFDLSTDRSILDLDSLGDFAVSLRFSPDGASLGIVTVNGKLVVLP